MSEFYNDGVCRDHFPKAIPMSENIRRLEVLLTVRRVHVPGGTEVNHIKAILELPAHLSGEIMGYTSRGTSSSSHSGEITLAALGWENNHE